MGLILLRHTTPAIEPGICYGQTNLAVADTFEAEATAIVAALPPYTYIVTSPLIRCAQLAQFIGRHASLAVETDPRLIEMDFGSWEGRAWSAIPRTELDAWAGDFLHARPHGGESVAMLRVRALAALMDWREANEPTLIVTHAGIIKAALATGNEAGDFDAKIDFGGFVNLSFEGRALYE
ncbi:MAG: alpha-ribazole phosphatase family protein [Pseudomonadota bacterium]